jgi:hypothetical protein
MLREPFGAPADRQAMDARDLIGKRVTITTVDLDAHAPWTVAHVGFEAEDGTQLVIEAHLHQARAKAVLAVATRPPNHGDCPEG